MLSLIITETILPYAELCMQLFIPQLLDSGETEATFYSDALPLAPGEVVFTDPYKTHIKMPAGKVVLTSVQADIVDENKRPGMRNVL